MQSGAVVNAMDDKGKTALHFAVNGGGHTLYPVLIKISPDNNRQVMKENLNELNQAAMEGTISLVHLLFQWGADVEIWGEQTALHEATRYGSNLEFIHALLQRFDNKPAYREDPEKRAHARRAFVNAQERFDERTALHFAVCKDNIEAVTMLLAAEADVNIRNYIGRTAVHMAVGKRDIMKVLLAAGADPNV